MEYDDFTLRLRETVRRLGFRLDAVCHGALTLAAGILAVAILFPGSAAALEYNTDRPGQDYRSFDMPVPSPGLCQAQCQAEAQCLAWTYVQPGIQGPQARCWLKHSVPNPVANNCCISGYKIGGSSQQPTTKVFYNPSIQGGRLDWCREWATNCGQPAADAFCQLNGYSHAVYFTQAPNIGASQPTRVINTGQICNQAFCDGFAQITCSP